ncbi:hypothetical protein [Polyangium spumosum]|uniref:Uncharacterized protein n=1 Tax=Polyangium spumosum TaxID=889282 RepID=A0A6N7PZT6_9BACT|nr:hypothetical protein [Polyangium spumosum]MRG96000.1 hypothetical protein [Polyangium spumosum]
MRYRGFQIVARGRSLIAERPLPEENAIYKIAGKTLAELHEKIDWWVFERDMGS